MEEYAISILGVAASVPYLLLIGAILVYSVYNGIKKQLKILESYKLVITEDAITREQS